MESDLLRSILYFFSGIFSYRMLSAFLNYSHLYNSFYGVIKSCLDIISLVDQSIESTNNYRYNMLKETDITEEEFDKIKDLDHKTILTWRQLVINSILQKTPKHLNLSTKFTNWNQAMNYHNSLYKKD